MTEIELKIVLDDSRLKALKARLKPLTGQDAPRSRILHSVYYDTPDHALRRSGTALRLRKDGRRWLQTVKSRARLAGGLSRVDEVETPAPGGRIDLDAIPDEAIRTVLLEQIGDAPLNPVCETRMRRVSQHLTTEDGSQIELALDSGEISAGEHTQPFQEAELELVRGRIGALYDVAEALLPDGGLPFSGLSKAARGFLLAETGEIAPPLRPLRAKTVALHPEQTSEAAARDVLQECFAQISGNIQVVAGTTLPEGPHQLRIGLRRLRAALALFRPIIGSGTATTLGLEARWLGQVVSHLRDLDVAITDLLEPEAALHPDEPGFAALIAAITARQDAARDRLRSQLHDARAQGFLIALARFVETRGWLDGDDHSQTARLAQPVKDVAAVALDKRWKSVRKRARGLEGLSIEARHELRKDLKKLRYSVEFLSPLYKGKRLGRFLKQLKRLQDLFGNLNDLAMAEDLFLAPDAPGAGDPAAQRALGRLLGARSVQAERDWERVTELWEAVRSEGPFWR